MKKFLIRMYYDDRFNPVDSNDFDDYDKETRRIHALLNLKSLDKNYHKYKKMVTLEDETGYRSQKKILIEYYSSGQTGNYIRNAQTGIYTKDTVGSKNEDLYFKITFSNSNHLFYDSPEQYERHQHDKISSEIKEKWLKKKLNFETLINQK